MGGGNETAIAPVGTAPVNWASVFRIRPPIHLHAAILTGVRQTSVDSPVSAGVLAGVPGAGIEL